MKFVFFFIFLMGTFVSCKIKPVNSPATVQTTAAFNSFGEINREKWADPETLPYPLNSLGTLRHPIGSRCSAVYLGSKFILTAAHCVMVEGGENLQFGDYLYEHVPLAGGGQVSSHEIVRFYFVELRRFNEFERAQNHWVVLELKTDIDHPKNSFKTSYTRGEAYDENHEMNFNLAIAGFSPNFNGNTNELTFGFDDCSFTQLNFSNKVAIHNCDAGRRDSGAPIFKCEGEYANWSNCKVSGIHLGSFGGYLHLDQYDSRYGNIAVTSQSFGPTIDFLTNDGPKPANLKVITNQY